MTTVTPAAAMARAMATIHGWVWGAPAPWASTRVAWAGSARYTRPVVTPPPVSSDNLASLILGF